METVDERTGLVSGQRTQTSGRFTQSLDLKNMSKSSQENGRRHRLSKGKITERREPVEGDRETRKVTYVFQASGTSSSSDSSRQTTGDVEEGETIETIKVPHCHTNATKNAMDKKARRQLIIASVLCTFFMIGEMVGGLLAGSLAIISDAAHLLTDLASFMIALLALYLANRPATSRFSFGWHRAEILGAFTSILMLWVLTGILVYEAVRRTQTQDFEINATIMLITSATGVAFNILLGLTLHQHGHTHGGLSHGHSHGNKDTKPQLQNSQNYGTVLDNTNPDLTNNGHVVEVQTETTPHGDKGHGHGHSHGGKGNNINVKAAFVHVVGDLLQSIGVLAAALIIYFKPEWKLADPICTFLFSVFVLITTVTIMKDIVMVLMEAAPKGLSFTEVHTTLLSVSSVVSVHNLRLWSLTMNKVAASAHLAIEPEANPHDVLKNAYATIRQNFSISDITFQIEEYVTEMADCHDCKGPKR